MGTYSLNWPGLGDFPIYVVDKENGTIYSDKDPLPYERRNLNHFGHHHVLLDDVMELFSSMTMVKASIKLVLLTDNVTMYPIYKDEKTKKRYLSLDTLLAFIIVFPFCPEFQRARAAVLRFLTLYPDLTCSTCGFIQRYVLIALVFDRI